MKKQPIYLYQCVICGEKIYTENTILIHCEKFTQWLEGIEGKGIDMDSPKIKIKVSGYIEMSQKNFALLLSHNDPHKSLVYSLPMGYVSTEFLEFQPTK
jgi:hypothetical protein